MALVLYCRYLHSSTQFRVSIPLGIFKTDRQFYSGFITGEEIRIKMSLYLWNLDSKVYNKQASIHGAAEVDMPTFRQQQVTTKLLSHSAGFYQFELKLR